MSAFQPILRIARASDDLDALLPFYCDGLGMEVLWRFENHEGFDGLVIGWGGGPYHLEFTRQHGKPAGRAPGTENLVVLYVPEKARLAAAVDRMRRAGIEPVPPDNPYWSRHGWTFEDPDGYRVVLQGSSWRL